MNRNNKEDIHQKLIDNLSEGEQKYLEKINTLSNKTRKNIHNSNDFLQQSIYSIIKNWSKTMKNILDDITLLELNSNNPDYWWRDIIEYINKVINIFVKKDRKIYIGLTLIIIAFLVFIIEITS